MQVRGEESCRGGAGEAGGVGEGWGIYGELVGLGQEGWGEGVCEVKGDVMRRVYKVERIMDCDRNLDEGTWTIMWNFWPIYEFVLDALR